MKAEQPDQKSLNTPTHPPATAIETGKCASLPRRLVKAAGQMGSRATRPTRQALLQQYDQRVDALPQVPFITHNIKKLSQRLRSRIAPDLDVLIIGAGLSGIAMASELKKWRKYDRICILERRQELGGTWDLFRYPGIRSDSDVFTYAYSGHPWQGSETLASGVAIQQYLKRTAQQQMIDQHIRYGQQLKHLAWSSEQGCWTAHIEEVSSEQPSTLTARFVVVASGYYNYEQPHQPIFAGQDDFAGQIIHPQHWQKDTDYQDKRVVIIGSGATAVTILPALLDRNAEQQAAHVTMLQRTPSYVASIPAEDAAADWLTQHVAFVSSKQAYDMIRWRNLLLQQGIYQFATRLPNVMKGVLKYKTKHELKGSGISTSHFTPSYNPWQQRLCAVPDGDLFTALKTGKADVVTDEIDRLTQTGILLKSGRHLAADIIVTATGLQLQMLGGASVSVDGEQVDVGERMTYKAVMVEGVPNLAVLFGYINASWTLKIDIACTYIIRLLKYMDKHNHRVVTAQPVSEGERVQRQTDSVMDAMQAGYIRRGRHVLPKQGDRYPWIVSNNYLKDRWMLLHDKVADKWLQFNTISKK